MVSLGRQHQHNDLGICHECIFPGPTPDLLNQQFRGWGVGICIWISLQVILVLVKVWELLYYREGAKNLTKWHKTSIPSSIIALDVLETESHRWILIRPVASGNWCLFSSGHSEEILAEAESLKSLSKFSWDIQTSIMKKFHLLRKTSHSFKRSFDKIPNFSSLILYSFYFLWSQIEQHEELCILPKTIGGNF